MPRLPLPPWRALASLLLLAGPVLADPPPAAPPPGDGVPRIEEIELVASPIIEGNVVNEYASRITTLTEEQVRELNAQDLPSALRRAPGVVISRHNPVGSFGGGEGGAILIRGQGASRPGAEISMLVDGIPKFVSVWTHPLMDVLSVDVIRSMDVYKGAQPVLFGGATYLAANPRDLPWTPPWTATAGATWRFAEGFTLSLDAQYVDRHTLLSRARTAGTTNAEEVDSYFVANGRLSWTRQWGDGGSSTEVFLAVENLTDTNYEMKNGYPMPGINFMAGLIVEF